MKYHNLFLWHPTCKYAAYSRFACKEECIGLIKKYNFNNENVLIKEFIERYDNLLDIVKSEY